MNKLIREIISMLRLGSQKPVVKPQNEEPQVTKPVVKPGLEIELSEISERDFYAVYPKADKSLYKNLCKHAKGYKITNNRLKYFLAQCAHESNGFTVTKENLNYSEAALNTVFSKYFKDAGRSAAMYARKPEAIANVVYANRMGNGSQATGDGWKYRGRGYIQLTGKTNYSLFSKDTGYDIIKNPDFEDNSEMCLLTAMWYWEKNNLNRFCDSNDFAGLTRAINGGMNGYADRLVKLENISKFI